VNDTTPSARADLVKRAFIEIRELRARLADADSARSEPIAIVGTGLRLPGGIRDFDAFADALANGVDAITDIPTDRWNIADYYDPDPDAPGRMTTRQGAFLEEIDKFDAEFFGVAPREAASMDPQQRLLLEVAWEALEHAAIPAGTLNGTPVGIFLGIANGDYGRALLARPDQLDVYASTGNAHSVAAGRLAYVLGLTGPTIAIDTACSSSLVALHLACHSLRQRECDLALAGGVNAILTPEMNIIFSQGRMMAVDGRCKSFDVRADGYVRSEGCVLLALRRLSDAQAFGERILGVIRGSAINQDGRSGGLTAPNGPAQTAVIRAALRSAGVDANEISYVETHGTGTPLGDPIEAGAIVEALCADRQTPLTIGSVKTNFGHLEAAAGVAGILKVLAALKDRQIPPNLHFREGNPHIDWSRPIAVPTTATPWAPVRGRLLAGVSSFGFSGCNAHAIVEEPPAVGESNHLAARSANLLCLSAKDPIARRDLAHLMRERMSKADADELADICFTANAGRTHFANRLACRTESAEGFVRGLDAFLNNSLDETLAIGAASASRPRIAFVFSGQGAQHAGMGRELYGSCAVFRYALDQCSKILSPLLGIDLVSTMLDVESNIDDVALAQPATFAIQYALASMWRSWGIEPALVMGHSLGEFAAACVAGVISLEDALTLVAERGRLTADLARPGAMAAVFAPANEVAEAIATHSEVSIAALNGPAHVVISGEGSRVGEIVSAFEARAYRVKPLRVAHPAHSALIEPVMPPFRARISRTVFTPGEIPFVSTVTGALASPAEITNAKYWCDHMRKPVRFADAVEAAQAEGITHWLEIGPHTVLLPMVAECIGCDERQLVPSLQRGQADWTVVSGSMARLYADGASVSWDAFHDGQSRRRVTLPAYPFRRKRHWAADLGRPAPLADSNNAWSAACKALDRQAGQGPLDLNVMSYPAKWDCLARVTLSQAIRTLRASGLFACKAESRTVEDVLRIAGIAPVYRNLITRWLNRLSEKGPLSRRGESFVAQEPLQEPSLSQLWAEAEHLFADNRPLLSYVAHCSSLLEPVLRGKENPLQTLFPQGSTEMAEAIYEQSATMRYINALAASGLEAVFGNVGHGSLRIMEVGAGTGGTTASLLAVLPPSAHYTFTDVSSAFFDRAKERFGGKSNISFATFDFEKEPMEQGYRPASFDIVAAANAVHASTDLRAALRRLRTLIAPGGMLLLVESTRHFEWFDMTTGLIEGWQHFDDDLRTDNPLLDAKRWHAALVEAGFVEVGTWPRDGEPAEVLGLHVILARMPGNLSGRGAATVEEAEVSEKEVASSAILDRLQEAYPVEQVDLLRDYVRGHVMRVLDWPADAELGRSARLMELGLDSLMAVRLRGLLARGLAVTLPASLIFDHPTIDSIAAYLFELTCAPGKTSSDEHAAPARLDIGAPPKIAPREAVPSDEEINAILMARGNDA
jgi:acyl transferase domain-containing protein/SAM-dependent methyltransferase